MSKINILPAQVYNRIAAGEVVERPYSVVKELVENSIDAGATEIEIFIEQGGKQLIRVLDNGSGIARDDLQAAFLPHATSKIEKASDLETIMTLGFRGEAVASVASVSKMTITSAVEGEKCYSLRSEGGVLGEILPASGAKGTDVKVETLFFNTPARLAFLKSDRAEEADIVHFVSRFILNRSDISFRLFVDGKITLQSFGGGDEEALVGVYGASILNNCYKIDAEKHGIKLRGYIGSQNYFKPNKTYQSVFLNGRYIVNQTIATALSNAYSSYAMKRQYPFYVLHVDVPPEIVDVNVTPNKSDVRFVDNRIVFGCIYNIVSSVLDGNSNALDYVAETPKTSPALEEKKAPIFSYEDAKKEIEKNVSAMHEAPALPKSELPFDLPSEPVRERKETTARDFIAELSERDKKASVKPLEEKEEKSEKYSDLFFEENVLTINASNKEKRAEEERDVFEENKRLLAEADKKSKQNRIEANDCRYAGKLFNTYIMYERGDEVYIVDQHAAHERLIFNRLKENMQNRNVPAQPMLLPYKLALNAFESTFIRENLENIKDMGFDIREDGERAFAVYAVPLDLADMDLGKFFNEILGDVGGFRAIRLESILKDKLASAACKAAVKGGMDLSEQEVKELFRLMDGDLGLKCPHGRPVVVRMTKTELEKMFKRIV